MQNKYLWGAAGLLLGLWLGGQRVRRQLRTGGFRIYETRSDDVVRAEESV